MASRLRPEFEAAVKANDAPAGEAYVYNAAACARRAIKNRALVGDGGDVVAVGGGWVGGGVQWRGGLGWASKSCNDAPGFCFFAVVGCRGCYWQASPPPPRHFLTVPTTYLSHCRATCPTSRTRR